MHLVLLRISVFACLIELVLNPFKLQAYHNQDSIELCVKIVDQKFVNGSWQDIELRRFSYNDNNILIEYEISKYQDNMLIPKEKIINVLDYRGRLSGQLGYKWDSSFGGRWMNIDGGCHIEYDENGNRSKYIDYTVEDNQEIIHLIGKSKYDENRNLIRYTTFKKEHNIIEKQDSIEYHLNKNGNIIEEIRKEWKNGGWIPIVKKINIYDYKGRIIETDNFQWQRSDWEEKDRVNYSYNENQRITEAIHQGIIFGKWQNMTKDITYLDMNDNKIEIQSQGFSSDAGWKTSLRTIFEYKKAPTTLPSIYTIHLSISGGIKPVSNFKLSHNYPNPFNATTQIQYSVPHTARISLKVYDIIGREVATLIDEIKEQGDYTVMWSGQDFASGVYFYRMVAEEFSEVRKMNLIK